MKICRIVIAAFLLILQSTVSAASVGDTTTVIILSTNDMHAKIDNFPKLKALVDDVRKSNPDVLLVSAGDMFTGNPVVDQYPDKGFPMIDLMNRTGFNLGTIGNHEFDYGQETLKKRMQQASFKLISCNIIALEPSGVRPDPFEIITLADGIRIGFVGAIQTNASGLPDSHPSKLANLKFNPAIPAIMEYKWLRDSCSILIALTHLGYETDTLLAQSFGEADVILGGHSHTIVNQPREFNGVLVMQAGSGLKFISKITLQLVNGKVVSKKAETLSILNYPRTDEELQKIVDQYNDNQELNRQIGVALNEIAGNDQLGSLMTDGVCNLEGIDVAFQNNGGIRIDKLAKGSITIKDIFKLDPFGNEVIRVKMTGAEIRMLLLNAFNRENEIDLQVSGLTYTVITDASGKGISVELKGKSGQAISDAQIFTAGMNSYIMSSYSFDHTDPGESMYITTAQALINYIEQKKEIDYNGVVRAFKR